jgi:hypothetical protein
MIVAMRRRNIIWLVLLCACAAVLGFAAAPHYRAPADSGEARLRARAVQFYRAQLLFDFWGIARCYTPAVQRAQMVKLAEFAASRASQRRGFEAETLKGMQTSADTVSADKLDVQLDGDWAMTGGTCSVTVEGGQVPYTLDQGVWVRSGGDWWVYQMSTEELIAYGNPPDYARKVLMKNKPAKGGTAEFKLDQPGGAPAAGATPPPQTGATPQNGTTPQGSSAAPGAENGQGAGTSTGGG